LEGTTVLLRNRVVGRNKIQDAWDSRKYVVVKRVDPEKHVYLVQPLDGKGEKRIENRMNIKPCTLVNPDDEKNHKRQTYNQFNNKNITNEIYSSSEEDDPVVVGYDGYQPLHRSTRTNAGNHSNINRLPRSVAN